MLRSRGTDQHRQVYSRPGIQPRAGRALGGVSLRDGVPPTARLRTGRIRVGAVISRRDAAQRLDIPVEMAVRHNLPAQLHDSQLEAMEKNPPAWLVQSRANRTGKKAVWVELTCAVCGFSEKARPKKWWPTWTHLTCEEHPSSALPEPVDGARRDEMTGIGSRFIAVIDTELD